MKQILIVIAVVAAGIGVWYWDPRPQPVVAPTRRLAPPGIYFLVQRISLTSDSGVQSFAPGTRVQAVSDSGKTMRVREGSIEFDVDRKKLTNDLDIAATAAKGDAASRQRFEAWVRHQKALRERQRQLEAQAVEKAERARKARQAIPRTPNPLDKGSYK